MKKTEAIDDRITSLGIVATADTCWGEPRIDGTRVTVDLVAKRFRTGEAMAAIARDYALTVLQVENAVRFSMVPLQHRRAWLKRRIPEPLTDAEIQAQSDKP